MIDVIIVGEDQATREIIKRLIKFVNNKFNVIREDPIRGGEIKNQILKFNRLAEDNVIIVLTDLDDYNCPIDLINEWFGKKTISKNMLFRIAVDEAESWLLADRRGIATFLQISEDLIPKAASRNKRNPEKVEIGLKYKSSLFLMNDLAKNSRNVRLKEQLTPKNLAKKGPEYNTAITPFIRDYWNVKEAIKNSYSLRKAVQRLVEFELG